MKISPVHAVIALALGGGIGYYFAHRSTTSPAEARLLQVAAGTPASAAQLKASWSALGPADKTVFDTYVTASDKATNTAEMQAAQDGFGKAFQAYQNAENRDAYAVGMALFYSYTDKRVGFGLPSH